MKIVLIVLFFLIGSNLFAQHEGHNMSPKPKMEEEPKIIPITESSSETNTNFVKPKKVRYDLVIADTIVNYSGKKRRAIAINGQIPAPTLHFTEGDTAEIHVHNMMHHETSLHWHGLILPNEQDGVPYLTTSPIKHHETHIYKFPIKQNGTYWYHSHTMLQEQIGLYGAFIIHKRGIENSIKVDSEVEILLSDWSNENPNEIERSLRYANDWYAIKKKATQSYGEALIQGKLGVKFLNEWKRMLSMDVSDVYYNNFLTNGKPQQLLPQLKAGQKIRLRVINGSASTYFWLNYAGGKITVVANDGKDVEPVEVDRLIVGVSETYDVVVTIPEDNFSYEFTATSEDRMGKTSLWLGNGEKKSLKEMPRLQYFRGMKMMNDMMTTGGNMKEMDMNMSLQKMDMNQVMYPELQKTDMPPMDMKMDNMNMNEHNQHQNHNSEAARLKTLNYSMLQSTEDTRLPNVPTRTLNFELTGNMNRYLWTIDNKTVSETDKILIKRGENIRIIIYNNSMMRHPMHLHGHFFRVLNGKGKNAPLKTVLDVMPMERDTIEFHASEEYGDWFFHCHILYHMMSGMGKILRYENTPANPQIGNPKKAMQKVFSDDRRYFLAADIALESNGSDGDITMANKRWVLQTEWRLGLNDKSGYESESHFSRFVDKKQFFSVYTGWDVRYRTQGNKGENLFGQSNTKNFRQALCIGVQYMLPLFILADVRVDQTGNARLQFKREDIPITPRLRLWAMGNSDFEYAFGARYKVFKYIALSSHYDSDMGAGAGLSITY